MNNIPLVTLITPLYNAEKYIAETIESVLNQTYQNWEMLIVDDCSTDDSKEIVRRYEIKDTRIKLIELDSNFGGPARPRNVGLDNSKGEYVSFLDADDVWLPNKLEEQLKFIEKEGVDFVHSLANIIDGNSQYVGFFNNQRIFNKLKYFMKHKNILYYTNYINTNSVFMKKSIGYKFSEDKNLIALEDWYFWLEVSQSHKIKLLDKILLNYRVHTNSISNRGTDKGYRKSLYMLAILCLNKKIALRHYFFSSILHILKIIGKNA
jgi:teichuronic acid biosynthesis glycosyltransferase TuaG